MQQTDVQSDQFTFATILTACARIRAFKQGIHVHQSLVRVLESKVDFAQLILTHCQGFCNLDRSFFNDIKTIFTVHVSCMLQFLSICGLSLVVFLGSWWTSVESYRISDGENPVRWIFFVCSVPFFPSSGFAKFIFGRQFPTLLFNVGTSTILRSK